MHLFQNITHKLRLVASQEMPQSKEITFSDPKLSEIFTNKKAQLIVSKSKLTRKINRTTLEFDSLRVFVNPLNPSKFEKESLSFLAHQINVSMPEYIAKVESLTEELESLLSGCHLDQADAEGGKAQEEHRVAELSSLESGLNEYKQNYKSFLKHIASCMASLPNEGGPGNAGGTENLEEEEGYTPSSVYKYQARPDLLQGKLTKAATPKEVEVYLDDFKYWCDAQWGPTGGKARYNTELFRKLDPAWLSCLAAGGIKEGASYEALTGAIEKELLISRPALRRRSDFLSTKAHKGEDLKTFIERVISLSELAYLDKGLSKQDLIIMVALMGINEPMRVKILEKFTSHEGCSLDNLRLYADSMISANPTTPGSCNAALNKKPSSTKTCSLCTTTGHDLASCWRNPAGPAYKHCSTCQKAGHTSENCRTHSAPALAPATAPSEPGSPE